MNSWIYWGSSRSSSAWNKVFRSLSLSVEGQHTLSQQVADLRNQGVLEFLPAKHSLGVGRRQQSASFIHRRGLLLLEKMPPAHREPSRGILRTWLRNCQVTFSMTTPPHTHSTSRFLFIAHLLLGQWHGSHFPNRRRMTACCENTSWLWKSSVCPSFSAITRANHFLSGNHAAQITKEPFVFCFVFLNLILVWSWLYIWIPSNTVRWTRWWLNFSAHSTNMPNGYRLGYSSWKVKTDLVPTPTGLDDPNQKSHSKGFWNTRSKREVQEIMGALLSETAQLRGQEKPLKRVSTELRAVKWGNGKK